MSDYGLAIGVPRGSDATPACGRATTRRTTEPRGLSKGCALEEMEGRETAGVTVVAADTPNERVTIEAPAGGTAALSISADAIACPRPMFLTTPPSILPLRAVPWSNGCAFVRGRRGVRISWEIVGVHDSAACRPLSDRLAG